MTHTTEQLLPCPFCGADDLKVYAGAHNEYAECTNCRAYGPDHKKRHWNTRSTSPELIAARKRIAELEAALRALMELNDNHGPFGGEMYQDRIDRTWDRARATLE